VQNGNGISSEYFLSPSRGRRGFLEAIDDIVEFVNEDAISRYEIGVGTDSEEVIEANGRAGKSDFVTVITVHRVGKHGRFFWKRAPNVSTFDRHDRILKEASFSLELAQKVIAHLRERLAEDIYKFAIHLDIGQNGPTKSMIQEIVGMITGNGFTARIKPESYAANKVADRFV